MGMQEKQRKQCDLSLSYEISASFFKNNSRHGDGGSIDPLVQNGILGKNVGTAVFGNDSAKTRTVRSRMLSKEEIDFNLLMTLAFHDLSRKKSDQLSSLLGAVVKGCMDLTFHDK